MSVSVYFNKKKQPYRVRWAVKDRNRKTLHSGSSTHEYVDDAMQAMIDKRRELKSTNGRNHAGLTWDHFAIIYHAARDNWKMEGPKKGAKKAAVLNPKTLAIDKRVLGLFSEYLRQSHPGIKLREITEENQINPFVIWLEKTPYRRVKEGTKENDRYRTHNGIAIVLKVLAIAFHFAFRKRFILDPLEFNVPKIQKVGRHLTLEELIKLFVKMRSLWDLGFRACLYALYQGTRRGEVVKLRWEKVTLLDGRPFVEIVDTKTGDPRFIEIHPEAYKAMGEKKESGLVFPMHSSTLSHFVCKAAREAGLGRIRLHDLRHTFATEFAKQKRDLESLMRIGGWESASSMRGYVHFTKIPVTSHTDIDLGVSMRTHPAPTQPLQVVDK